MLINPITFSFTDWTLDGHWESITYEALEDPEYIIGDTGRITWTATPIHGTPDKPNRERIMRSPPVLIGGMYWNIKYFPRGNDGTEHMSVYIECSSSPPEETEPKEDVSSENVPDQADGAHQNNADSHASDSDAAAQMVGASSENPQLVQEVNDMNAEATRDTWEIAAQVSCVVYNPNEPRVNAFRKTSHRFNADNADWGWTRFHGPWESMHQRQRLERQALLRNDTLAFTAYIRTVKDDTKTLWWHAPKKGTEWDSYVRIGVKSLATASCRDNAIIAAISCWLHLNPIANLIKQMKIPDALTAPGERKRPLFAALQQLLEYMFNKPEDRDQHAMVNFVAWLDWYLTETDPPRDDTSEAVSLWEALRRIMNYEASGTGDMAAASDYFEDVLLLKQPDPWKDESPIASADLGHESDLVEPRSVQETLDLVSASSNPLRPWVSFTGQSAASRDLPAILQVELHRQKYDKKTRHWDKLTHRIEINENITYVSAQTGSKEDYTLYGMVVHTGALDSEDFYSVIRPEGPGTRWIKYSGGGLHRGATCLTKAQAITAHEGKGSSSTGGSAVAYVVLYVRTDSLSSILLSSNQPHQPASSVQPSASDSTEPEIANTENDVWLRIYESAIFKSHEGRGLPDLWAPRTKEDSSPFVDIQLPKETDFIHVDKICSQEWRDASKLIDENGHCILFHLDVGLNTARGLPRLISAKPHDTLGAVASKHGGCRLWVHHQAELSNVDGKHVTTEDEVGTEQEAEGTAEPQNATEDAEMTQEQPVDVPATVEDAEVRTETQDDPASLTSEPQAPVGDDVPPSVPQEQTEGGPESEDTAMAEAPDSEVAVDPGPSTRARHVQTPSTSHIYIFVKLFDSQAQTLRGVGSRVVHHNSEIHTEVASILGSEEELFDIYHENSRSIHETDRIRPSRRFSDYDFGHGSIFIAQGRATPEE